MLTDVGWKKQKRDIRIVNHVIRTCWWLISWMVLFADLMLLSNSSLLVLFTDYLCNYFVIITNIWTFIFASIITSRLHFRSSEVNVCYFAVITSLWFILLVFCECRKRNDNIRWSWLIERQTSTKCSVQIPELVYLIPLLPTRLIFMYCWHIGHSIVWVTYQGSFMLTLYKG